MHSGEIELSFFGKLFGSNDDSNENDQQLWIMIKENSYFRSDEHLSIVDELAELMENEGLGELDGHSSGRYQFEINFYDVENYAKGLVEHYFHAKHPHVIYTVSDDYETTYELRE